MIDIYRHTCYLVRCAVFSVHIEEHGNIDISIYLFTRLKNNQSVIQSVLPIQVPVYALRQKSLKNVPNVSTEYTQWGMLYLL